MIRRRSDPSPRTSITKLCLAIRDMQGSDRALEELKDIAKRAWRRAWYWELDYTEEMQRIFDQLCEKYVAFLRWRRRRSGQE